MKKAILALALVTLMVVAFASPALAADPVYRLTAAEVTAFLGNTEGHDFFMPAGSPAFSAAPGGGIRVSGKSDPWNALDLKVDFIEAGKTYTVIVGFASSNPVQFALGQMDSPWNSIHSSDEGVTKATLTWKINDSTDFGNPKRGMRLRTECLETYDITSVVIWEGDPPAGSTGEISLIAFAVSALAVSGGGAAYVIRRIKK